MGTIGDVKSKIQPSGKFLTQDERDVMYRTDEPFFVKRVTDRVSNFKNEKTGEKKEQWVITAVHAKGGDEWQMSFTKNFMRDPLFTELQRLLQTDEYQLKGIGPCKLGKFKAGNGNLAWTIEDWEEPKAQPAAPVIAAGAVKARCVSCGETVSGAPILMGSERYVTHDCPKDRKKVLLPVAA